MSDEITKAPNDSGNLIAVIERYMTDKTVDVDKLDRLLQMQERVLARQALESFNADFAAIQTELPRIEQNGEVLNKSGGVQSRYAKFEDINSAVKPILQKYGFSIYFQTATDSNSITVTGTLCHRDSHSIQTNLSLPSDTSGNKNAVQAIGSSVSYGKRYVMCALLNLTVGGEDDNGNPPQKTDTINAEQIKEIDGLLDQLEKLGRTRAQFFKWAKIEAVADIPQGDSYNGAVSVLKDKIKLLKAGQK